MDVTIYSIGDSQFLTEIINSVAMLFAEPALEGMIKMGLALGILGTLFKAIFDGAKNIEIQHFMVGFIMYGAFFVPKVDDVKIEDVYTGSVNVVDNVPVGVAFAGYAVSYIGYKTMELFEIAYTDIESTNAPALSQQGFAESLKVLTSIRRDASDLAVWSAMNESKGGGYVDFRYSWISYIQHCSLEKVGPGKDISVDQLFTSPIDTSLFNNHTSITFQYLLEPSVSTPATDSCLNGWETLNDATIAALGSDDVRKALDSILRINSGTSGNSSMDKITSSLDLTTKASLSSQSLIKASILEPLMHKAAEGKYKSMTDVSSAIMINESITQRNTQWAAEQTMFQSIVRPVIAFFEAFVFAITPIMCFALTLGKAGIQVASRYFVLLLWVQLWYPLLSITNLYISMAARREIVSFSALSDFHWDSFYAINNASEIASTWVATGGMLASAVPVIAMMLLYGTSTTASAIAARMKSADHVNENYATPSASTTPALVNNQTGYAANSVAGASAYGSSINAVDFGVASQISSSTASANTKAENAQSAVNDSINKAHQLAQQTGRTGKVDQSLSEQISTSDNRTKQLIDTITSASDKTSKTNTDQGTTDVTTVSGKLGLKAGGNKDEKEEDSKNSSKTSSLKSISGDLSAVTQSATRSETGDGWTVTLGNGKQINISDSDLISLQRMQSSAYQAGLSGTAGSTETTTELGSRVNAFSEANSEARTFSQMQQKVDSNSSGRTVSTGDAAHPLAASNDSMDILRSERTKFTPEQRDMYNANLQKYTDTNSYPTNDGSGNEAAAMFNVMATGTKEQRESLLHALNASSIGGWVPTKFGNPDQNAHLPGASRDVPSQVDRALQDAQENRNIVNNAVRESPTFTPETAAQVQKGEASLPEQSPTQQYNDNSGAFQQRSSAKRSQVALENADDISQRLNSQQANGHGYNDQPLSATAESFWSDIKKSTGSLVGDFVDEAQSNLQKHSDYSAAIVSAQSKINSMSPEERAQGRQEYIDTLEKMYPNDNWGKFWQRDSDEVNAMLSDSGVYGNFNQKPDDLSYAEYGHMLGKVAGTQIAMAKQAHEERMSSMGSDQHQQLLDESGMDNPRWAEVYATGAENATRVLASDNLEAIGALARRSPLVAIGSAVAIDDVSDSHRSDINSGLLSDDALNKIAEAKIQYAPPAESVDKVSSGDGIDTYQAFDKDGQLSYTYSTRTGGNEILSATLADSDRDTTLNIVANNVLLRGANGSARESVPFTPQSNSYIQNMDIANNPADAPDNSNLELPTALKNNFLPQSEDQKSQNQNGRLPDFKVQ